MKRIAVGIDGSRSSVQAARFAGELAEAAGAELVVIYVRGHSQTPDGPMPARMAAVRASYERERERRARAQAAGRWRGCGCRGRSWRHGRSGRAAGGRGR